MTDYSSLLYGLGGAAFALGGMGGWGLLNYLSGVNLAKVAKSYAEALSKTMTERRILAQDLYAKGRSDGEVQTILDNTLPLPETPDARWDKD